MTTRKRRSLSNTGIRKLKERVDALEQKIEVLSTSANANRKTEDIRAQPVDPKLQRQVLAILALIAASVPLFERLLRLCIKFLSKS